MIFDFTVGVCAALTDAGVNAVSVMTSLAETTFYVIGTFTSTAIGERIPAVAGWARADGTAA